MNEDLFQSYEIKERNGKLVIILELNPQMEEFAAEPGLVTHHQIGSLEDEARQYIEEKFPMIEDAVVSVVAEDIPLLTFPLHEVHQNS
ncbi:hypothetical protein GCM10008986_26730 [Salinibacillus aidingensis]|uniref:Uncharacterized protein n=1 Tax=Salinibacillus aidingensis TaxID=237684 RepID=A0ABN1BJU3_9BACI